MKRLCIRSYPHTSHTSIDDLFESGFGFWFLGTSTYLYKPNKVRWKIRPISAEPFSKEFQIKPKSALHLLSTAIANASDRRSV